MAPKDWDYTTAWQIQVRLMIFITVISKHPQFSGKSPENAPMKLTALWYKANIVRMGMGEIDEKKLKAGDEKEHESLVNLAIYTQKIAQMALTGRGLLHAMNESKCGQELAQGAPVPGGPVPASALLFDVGNDVRKAAERLNFGPEGRYADWGTGQYEGKTGEWAGAEDEWEDDDDDDDEDDDGFEFVTEEEMINEALARQRVEAVRKGGASR
ncbi:hypothetical protein BU16DRAFT_527159 [Lophium mytilinum]|uniref:Uncharacterized protein n=1 Tax=Lophium mytilinum TaxID=390894 RepID=A0A6A6QSY8_9PEZI|nr:hypothetical protein BU16DRAFT_527159 [Lophium mytilinum]